MKVNFVHICEHAFFSDSKKLSVVEIYDVITAPGPTINYPKLSLVMNVSGEMTPSTRIVIQSPLGQDIMSVPLTNDMFELGKESNNILIHAIAIPFTESGLHRILLKEGDEVASHERRDGLMVKFT